MAQSTTSLAIGATTAQTWKRNDLKGLNNVNEMFWKGSERHSAVGAARAGRENIDVALKNNVVLGF